MQTGCFLLFQMGFVSKNSQIKSAGKIINTKIRDDRLRIKQTLKLLIQEIEEIYIYVYVF